MLKHLLLSSLLSAGLAHAEISALVPAIKGEWTSLDTNPAVQTAAKAQDHAWHFQLEASAYGSDPMTVKLGEVWHSYYTGIKTLKITEDKKPATKPVGAVYARTSPDLKTWSEPKVVAWGGQAGEDLGSAGHPCVIELSPKNYYLFRTQIYGQRLSTNVYHSTNALDFGLYGDYADAKHFITSLPVVIEDVVKHEGQWFAVQGNRMTKIEWNSLTIPARPTTRPTGVAIRVALYDDGGSAGKGVPMVTEQLTRCKDIELTKLNADSIRAGLNGYDVVIFTGGSSGKQANTIGLIGREQVRRFVNAGGGYVGICAGAYLACDGFSWAIKVLDAKTPSSKWMRGIADLKIETTEAGLKAMNLPKETMVKYHNGPLLVPANNPAIPDFEPLTYFRTEIAKNGSPEGIMINSPAIAQGKFGAGKVIACSPHPEQTEGLDRWIESAVRTVAAQ